MTEDKRRFAPPRPQPRSRGLWSWEEFVFGLTRGAVPPSQWTAQRRRKDRRS